MEEAKNASGNQQVPIEGDIKLSAELLAVRTVEFLYREPEDLMLDGGPLRFNIAFSYSAPDVLAMVNVRLLFQIFQGADKDEDDESPLVRIKTLTIFAVPEIESLKKDGSIYIPVPFLRRLCEIAFDTTRGLCMSRLLGTRFEHFVPPILNGDFINPIHTDGDGTLDFIMLKHDESPKQPEDFL